MPSNALQKVSSTFRQTATGVKLGRMLFDPSIQFQLKPQQIAAILKNLGFDIPSEVQIGLGTAQMIMSGGAFVNAISKGQTLLQIGQLGASTVNQAIGVLQLLGILEHDSIFARTVSIGANTAAVLSSGGTNVMADIALVMDIVAAAVFPPDERPKVAQALDRQNLDRLKERLVQRTTIQKQNASQLIKNYQDQKISIFEFIGEFAIQSGDNFHNYFPEWKVFLPTSMVTMSEYSSEKANYGGFLFIARKRELVERTLAVTFETTSTNKYEVLKAFYKKFVSVPFAPYFLLNSLPEMRNRIPMGKMVAISLLSDDIDNVGDGFDIVPYLNKLWLTPSDFYAEGLLTENLSKPYIPPSQGAISFNGVNPYLSQSEKTGYALEALDRNSTQRAIEADKNGDISTLVKNKKVYNILKTWGTIPNLPSHLSQYNTVNYFDISNFLSMLSIVNYLDQDEWINRLEGGQNIWQTAKRQEGGFMQYEISNLERDFTELLNTSTARFLNMQARENVAKFYNTTQTKVEFKTNKDGTAFVVPKK